MAIPMVIHSLSTVILWRQNLCVQPALSLPLLNRQSLLPRNLDASHRGERTHHHPAIRLGTLVLVVVAVEADLETPLLVVTDLAMLQATVEQPVLHAHYQQLSTK
jgi:hypothetical protein